MFLDLEGTQFSHEMIAIGAVHVVLGKNGRVRKEFPGFKRLVLAKNHIGKVVVELTGLTDAAIKAEGISYRKAMEELKKYVGRAYAKSLFITFGTHDLRIVSQSVSHNLDADKEDARFIAKSNLDLSAYISKYVKDGNGNPMSLENYLKIFGLAFDGTKHDPLDDARNLVRLYSALFDSENLLAEEYKKVLAKSHHLPQPLPEMINQLVSGREVTPDDFDRMIHDYVS